MWDTENFLMGAPSGDLQGPLSPLEQQEALLAPQEPVEVGGPFRLLALAALGPFKKQVDWDCPGGPVAGAPSAGDQVCSLAGELDAARPKKDRSHVPSGDPARPNR